MTVLEERRLIGRDAVGMRSKSLPVRASGPARARGPVPARGRVRPHQPAPVRPNIAPLCYRGSGAARSRAVHTRRPVSTAVTVFLAGIAALITFWLGSLAHISSAGAAAPAATPDRLAVVQVQAGESLQQLAGRVAPDAPIEQVVSRIRELNDLGSAAVDAGQTLIAPLG